MTHFKAEQGISVRLYSSHEYYTEYTDRREVHTGSIGGGGPHVDGRSLRLRMLLY